MGEEGEGCSCYGVFALNRDQTARVFPGEMPACVKTRLGVELSKDDWSNVTYSEARCVVSRRAGVVQEEDCRYWRKLYHMQHELLTRWRVGQADVPPRG